MRRLFQALMAVVALTVVLSISMSSCQNDDYEIIVRRDQGFKADSMLSKASEFGEERLLAVTDSLYDIGYISIWKRAVVYYGMAENQGDAQKAMEVLKEALAEENGMPNHGKDSVAYYFCVAHLALLQSLQNHNEEALQTATKAIEPVKKIDDYYYYYRVDLLSTLYGVIMDAQIKLRMMNEAEQTAEEAYTYSINASTALADAGAVIASMKRVTDVVLFLQENERYTVAEKWIKRSDSLLNVLMTFDDRDPYWSDIRLAENKLSHAKNALGLGHSEEGEKAYQDYLKTDYAKTYEGQLSSVDYLMIAKRWSESAEYLTGLEAFYASLGIDLSLDALRQLANKFKANYMSGRHDTALHVASYIFEHLDSAIFRERESNTAEMATIYETQKKDAEIAQQRIELTQERVLGLAIAIVLLTIFFIIYTLIRRRAAQRMAEMRAQQERIENELQIARNIQMSMVPSQFPDYEGLDMYASMTPAKEVGGDLYGYVLIGDKLYFALGDVSGKGVPASLFMAQATRLFRTLAAQQMMPAEICTHMNDALSGEDNESGMFVTFWLGLVDLKTGHLDFCNAGHNPPVIGGGEHHAEFLEMIPNTPIGLWPGMEYEGEAIETIKGRPLFIYTDGLNEAENRQQDQFGDDRLLEILRTSHFDTAQHVIDILSAAVEQHRNGAEPNDDLTMMCVRIN